MGVTNGVDNSSSMLLTQRLSGPPMYILLLAVALEVLFWVFDIQVQYVEIWIVALVVPLALSVAKPQEDASGKRPAKKFIEEDGRPRKKTPQVIASRKPATERVEKIQSPADNERAAGKAKIDSYSTVISACAKQGDKAAAEKWLQKMLDAGI